MRKFLRLLCLVTLLFPFVSNAQKQPDATYFLNLVKKNSAATNLSEADLKNVRISDAYYDEHAKVYMVYLQQTYKSVDVENIISPLAFKNEALATGRFIKSEAIETSAKNISNKTSINARDAMLNAMNRIGLINTNKFSVALTQSADAQHFVFEKFAGLLNNINVDLKWVSATDDNKNFKLSWNVFLHTEKENAAWLIAVDALSGQVIRQKNLTVYESASEVKRPHQVYVFEDKDAENNIEPNSVNGIKAISSANYNVIPYPAESPVVKAGTQTVVTNPWTLFPNTNATTLKWNSDGTTDYATSVGNNVFTSEDLSNKNNELGVKASSSTAVPNLNFKQSINYDKATISDSNQQFSLTNLFYWNNFIHDMVYQYGFDEASGNFQNNNLSRGGQGNDRVNADGQDGYSMDNANFATPADGSSPRMQMFLWSRPYYLITLYGNQPSSLLGPILAKASVISLKGEKAPLTKNVVYYKNNTSGHNGCVAASNSTALNGQIALVDRGGCNFSVKVENAQKAGAVGVIVGDTLPANQSGLITMTYQTRSDGSYLFDTVVKIPSVFLRRTEADLLRNALNANQTVNVTLTSTNIDGSLDNGIVTHEYTHGISNRLTGGPNNVGCLTNPEQMGEGISDYDALMFTTNWKKAVVTDGSKPKAIGNYVLGFDSTGPGIRTYPYSTDLSINPWTYDSLPFLYTVAPNRPEVHILGEVWCEMLWEMNWAIIQQVGSINQNFADVAGTGGNSIAMNLFIEGMKLQRCNPTFLEARNAILQADTLLYAAKYSPAIWKAFAKRGLGYSADQKNRDSIYDNVPAYDLPAVLPVTFGSFTAEKQKTTALLRWTTAQESNTDKFVVERSADGKLFNAIGEVKAAGYSATEKSYQLIDNAPLKGDNIYHIKEMDKDGKTNYSDVRSLNFADAKPTIKISPNPATNMVTINIPGNNQNLDIRLLSNTGQLLNTYIMNNETLTINVSNLASGMYNITINGDGYISKYKLVIQ